MLPVSTLLLFFLPLSTPLLAAPSFLVHKPHLPLQNASMRCCLVVAPPFITFDHGKIGGFGYESYRRLQEQTGFKCSQIVHYTDPNSTTPYNSFIEYLSGCKLNKTGHCENLACEFGLGSWWETENRTGVAFLPPHGYDDFKVFTMDVVEDPDSGGFVFKAFDKSVWIAIVCLFTFFVIIRMCDREFPEKTLNGEEIDTSLGCFGSIRRWLLKNTFLYRLRKAVKSSVSKMIHYNDNIGNDQSTRQWVLSIVIALCGLFLMLVYEASMTASLVQESYHARYESLGDFLHCRILDDEVCMRDGDAVEQFWSNLVRTRRCKGDENGKVREFRQDLELSEATYNDTCKFSLTDGGAAFTITEGEYCGKLRIVGQPFLSSGVSFVTPHGWKHFEALRRGQLEAIRLNPEKTLEEYLGKLASCSSSVSTVNFQKLRIFFVTAYLVCLILLIYMICDPKGESIEEEDKCDEMEP